MQAFGRRSMAYYGLATSSMIYLYKYPEVSRRDGFPATISTTSSPSISSRNDRIDVSSKPKVIHIRRYEVVNDHEKKSNSSSLFFFPFANSISLLFSTNTYWNSSQLNQSPDIQFRTYTAEWCGPSSRVSPHIEQLEKQGKIRLIHEKEVPVNENKRRGLIIPCFDVIQIAEGIEASSNEKDVEEANIKVVYSIQTIQSEELDTAVQKAITVKNKINN